MYVRGISVIRRMATSRTVCSRKMCCACTVDNRVAGILVQNLREQLFGVRRLS